MNKSSVHIAVRYALLTCAASLFSGTAALAQTGPAASPQGQSENSATATQLKKIQVTGTRILRTTIETAQPITVVTAKQIKQSGLATIGDVLGQLTQASSSINTLVNNTINGGGSNNIDLRNFGPSRVLVLVNGQRWTSGLGGTVDLNTIPASVIDHVEILQDGASAIYGSDAITGVVNVITVKNFNGAEASARLGMYQNSYMGFNHWDGKTQNYNFTIGNSGPHSGIVISASYMEQDGIWASNIAQTAAPGFTAVSRLNGQTGPGVFNIQGPPGFNPGSATCSANGDCNMTLINTPDNNPTLANFRDVNPSDLVTDLSQLPSYFMTPLEDESFFLQGHYDISNNLTFTTMALADNRTSEQVITKPSLALGPGGFTQVDGIPFGIGANNPYNPFGKDLVAQESQYCPSGALVSGPNKGNACTPNLLLNELGRMLYESPTRDLNENVASYTFRMGLNGFFDALGGEWDWDVHSNFGRILNTARNFVGSDTFQLASQLDAPGGLQCNGPGQAAKPAGDSVQIGGLYYPILIPGCVPLNLFGGYNTSTKQGSITPEMLAYSDYLRHRDIESNLRDYTANLTGDLVQLPAGPLAAAIGAESLEEDGFDAPDVLSAAKSVDEVPQQPTAGRQWTNSEYVEFNVPLLANVPLAKALNLDLANRWSQISWTGGDTNSLGFGEKHGTSATTAQAKLRWQVDEDLLLRGSWSQGFRAPNLSDLFEGAFGGFPIITDPCAPTSENGGWTPGTPLPPGCGQPHTELVHGVVDTSGGNPLLQPETAVSRSVGFVYNPSWIPGFDVSADYYKIDLNNVIGSIGTQFILDECYIRNDPDYCSRLTVVGNQVTGVNSSNINVGEEYSRGVDVTAHERLPMTPVGAFTLATHWTFVQSFVSVLPSATNTTGFISDEERGNSPIPQRKGDLSLGWNLDDWSANWQIQYIGPMWTGCSGAVLRAGQCSNPDQQFISGQAARQGRNHIGTTVYNNVRATYHSDVINTSFSFGIRNLFNKQYPSAGPLVGLYQVPSRFFYINVDVKF